jgi:hypothetical protein
MHERPLSADQRGHPSIILQPSPAVTDILRRCYSHVEALDRHGNPGLGVTNLKRVFGRPSELRVLVEAIAATVQQADAIAAAGIQQLSALAVTTDLRLGHRTQKWLATSDDPDARTSGGPICGRRLARNRPRSSWVDDVEHEPGQMVARQPDT